MTVFMTSLTGVPLLMTVLIMTSQGEDEDYIERAKLEAEQLKKFQKLFASFKFFLNREVPREILTFCIRLVVFVFRQANIGGPGAQ